MHLQPTKQVPFTLVRLYSPEYVGRLYDAHIMMGLFPVAATDYSRAVCRGEVPTLPEGDGIDAELTAQEVEAITGFAVYSQRERWASYRMSNAPWANNALPQIRVPA